MANNSENNLLPENITKLVIDSGNLLAIQELIRNNALKLGFPSLPTEELVQGIQEVINQRQQNEYPEPNQRPIPSEPNTAYLTNNSQNTSANIPTAERQTFRITVKLFLFDDCRRFGDCPSLRNGIDIVLQQLGIDTIDSLIISLPNKSTKLSLDDIKPVWQCAEQVLADGKVTQLGVSDLDTSQLTQLYEWAEKTKPMTNHINLEACCVIPEEMSAYAKQNNIQLLTHNDPKDFLPEERFTQLVSQLVTDPKQWKRGLIARYSVIVQGKGILQNKGYILLAKKCGNC